MSGRGGICLIPVVSVVLCSVKLLLGLLSLASVFLLLVVADSLLVWLMLRERVIPFLIVCLLLRRTRARSLVSR